jgi:hypothetical protein
LVAAGELQQFFSQFFERGPSAGADIGRRRISWRRYSRVHSHRPRQNRRPRCVAEDRRSLTAIDRVQHPHDDRDIRAFIVLAWAVDIQVAQADIV